MKKNIRLTGMFAGMFTLLGIVSLPLAINASTIDDLQAGWEAPERTYKSHTRWWWPGNILTMAEITWQLEQMAEQGFGGVEVMSAYRMYEKGNTPYLSPEFLEKIKHAVAEGKRLDMDVSLTFSPGWSFGGPWVKKEDQSKVLSTGHVDVKGGQAYSGSIPLPEIKTARPADHLPEDPGLLQAVVAGRIVGKDKLDGNSLIVLKDKISNDGKTLEWEVPQGNWRIMTFWLTYTLQVCQAQNEIPPSMVIDHMNKGAVLRYTDHLGSILYDAVGEDFGTTVDSFFCDSFEIHPLGNTLLWSNNTTAEFKGKMGYDLTKYLPAIWYDIGPLTPRIRYDLQVYLEDVGMESVYETFGNWCREHNIQDRIQPHYRFTPEIVKSAGAIARPETEVTTARFEPIADPRKATASGARFYGRDFVSAESYTFIHPARYRTDLMDMKIATDAFIRDGISQFYNHGYFASPEKHVAPGRDMPWANRISHWNTWWEYYHLFGDYVARSCFLARQGDLVADVLIYSPQATAWSENALWGTDRRVMLYGNLAKTLVANGYDFDIVNDDLLQNQAIFKNGQIVINGYARRILILPAAKVIPIESMRAIEKFVKSGGTVIALEQLPEASAGMKNHQKNDKELAGIVKRVFESGKGKSKFISGYEIDRKPFSPARKAPEPTAPWSTAQKQLLNTMHSVISPDFALAWNAQSNGLTHIHKKVGELDVYFVTNLQPDPIKTDVTFRVSAPSIQKWDAVTGKITLVEDAQSRGNKTTIPIDFAPWESAFFVFGKNTSKIAQQPEKVADQVVLNIDGDWKMRLEGHGFKTHQRTVSELQSWTENPRTKSFSGSGVYETTFNLPSRDYDPSKRWVLDLGKMKNIAEVELNGKVVGVDWIAPYELDITNDLRSGKNSLRIKVTNTLINYVTSMTDIPEVPTELQSRLGNTNPDLSKERAYKNPPREFKEKDLPLSGLIGPVVLRSSE